MFKLLITAGLIYVAYKFFFAKSVRIESFQSNPNEKVSNSDKNKKKEGEFVDYEEVE
ncbi:MAG: hypothetical protein RLZZ417_1071 [Bacteroidota bacterium]|jgi:hypothetical protein